MFTDKGQRYENGGDVAFHEGGYDLVQVASLFWGGALLKGGKKASETADAISGVFKRMPNGLKNKVNDLSPSQRNLFLEDLGKLSDTDFQKFVNNPNLVDSWKKMKDLGADDALRRNPGALEALDKKTSGVEVPLPNTYLDANYITTQLSKFDNGGPYLVPKSVLDNRGRALLGRPDGQFIIPKSEMDNLL